MKQTEQSKLEYCISLVKRCPEYKEGTSFIFHDWLLEIPKDIPRSLFVDHFLYCSGDENIRPKTLLVILTALIADLERHLGIKPMTEAEAYAQLQEIEQNILEKRKEKTFRVSFGQFVEIIDTGRISELPLPKIEEISTKVKVNEHFQDIRDMKIYKLVELTGSEGGESV